jgi:hypothetical protein
MKMKTHVLSGSLVLSIGLLRASGAQPDGRFDGVWVGTETTQLRSTIPMATQGAGTGTSSFWQTLNKPHPAKIIIAEDGRMLGVAEGHCPGRYTDVQRSGNVISFQAGDCKLEVSLSADGKTLTEKGVAMGDLWTGSGNARYTKRVPMQVTGTFHKQKQ